MKIKQLHEYESGTAIELAPVTIPDAVVNPDTQESLTDALERIEEAIPTKVSQLSNDSGYATISAMNEALGNKVDAVSGKGLSTNDYTSTEKNKLSGIAAGAEVNQNAFSNVTVGSTTISADGKTDTLTLVAGSNVTLTPDAANDKITIAASDTTYSSKTAASGGTDVSLVTTGEKYTWNTKASTAVATTSTNGLMSASDKSKLNGLSNYDDTSVKSSISSLQTQLDTLVSGDASSAIESFNEITAFLDGVEDSETLEGIIAGIETQIAAKADKAYGIKSITRSGTTFTVTRADDTTFTFSQQDNNTTYTFSGGTNQFTVTPSGGSAQTVSVTPSISNNVTYSGTLTSGQVAVLDGTAGKIRASGYTIASSVPSGAKFTDTTYSAATTSAAGLMSASDKSKLDGIASGATAVTTSTVSGWGYTKNTGTVTSVATGVGLTGGSVTTSGTIKTKLRSETALTVDSSAATTTSGRVYPVAVDKSGYLAVNVPWTDNNTTYSFSNSNPTLAWGTKSTVGTVGGVALTVTMPANPNTDTHYTTGINAGASGAVANSAQTNPYVTVKDNSTYRSQIQLKGSGATTVSSDANGVITISSTDTNTNTTYSAGSGISLSGTAFSHADTSTLSGNYGPTANVTGSNGATIVVPQITVDGYGHVTAVTNRTYTSVDNNTTYSSATTSAAGLMSAADKSKLDGIASGATANVGTITGITMNGASKGTSGVVNLGTVITAHQDISGLAKKTDIITVTNGDGTKYLSDNGTYKLIDTSGAIDSLPIGTVLSSGSMSGNIFGNKWLECDGSAVDKEDYPDIDLPKEISTDGFLYTLSVDGSSSTYDYIFYLNGNIFISDKDGENNIQFISGLTTKTSLSTWGFVSMAYGNGVYVAVTYEGKVMYSTSGTSWSISVSEGAKCVAFGNGRFILSNGSTNTLQYSSDGKTWSDAYTLPDSLIPNTICYENNMFVGTNWNGNTLRIYNSTDGVSWSYHDVFLNDNFSNYKIWFICGKWILQYGQTCYISSDLYFWEIITIPGNAMTVLNSGTVVCADKTTLYYSYDLKNWRQITKYDYSTTYNYIGLVAVGDNQIIRLRSYYTSSYSNSLYEATLSETGALLLPYSSTESTKQFIKVL